MNHHRPFCQHWISHTLLVAMATDHAIGLLMISAARARLIARNRRLNSMPQPLDNRKSRSVWLSSERTDALNTNWAFLESMVLMVICERREQCVITRWTRFQHFWVITLFMKFWNLPKTKKMANISVPIGNFKVTKYRFCSPYIDTSWNANTRLRNTL